uniref:tumor necrosis factor receptor superfamily member 14-like isoform X2 n=1 Tax=Pristiophorus japonicus TaxID=55135 RepID=UPI00398F6B91
MLYTSNLKTPVLKGRWHGSDSSIYSHTAVPRQSIKYQELVQVPISTEKGNTVAVMQQVSFVTILIGISIGWKLGFCEKCTLSFSGTRKGDINKICFIILLVFQLQAVTCCGLGEYMHEGECCSFCLSGSIVYKHCTREVGTTCKPCTAGEYIEHPNGLDKCLKCKACDQELGLQIKDECTNIRNTICESLDGYYCRDRSCDLGRKHKTCLPGQGVKEKGTGFKDTVCEVCPSGTYSSTASLTESCKNWTRCDKQKQNKVKPGSPTSDVVCEKKANVAVVLVPILLVIIIAGAGVFIWWKYCRTRVGTVKASDAESLRHEKNQNNPRVVNKPTPETAGFSSAEGKNSATKPFLTAGKIARLCGPCGDAGKCLK